MAGTGVVSLALALLAVALVLGARSNTHPTPECFSNQTEWIDRLLRGTMMLAAAAVVAGVLAVVGAARRRRTTPALCGGAAIVVALVVLVAAFTGYECVSMGALATLRSLT